MTSRNQRFIDQTRREFLHACTVAAGGLMVSSLPGCGAADDPESPRSRPKDSTATKKGTVLSAGWHKDGGGQTLYTLARIDLDAEKIERQIMRVPFFAHGMVPDPHDASVFLLFEKHGPGCCKIDLSKGAVVKQVTTADHRQFYGHGAFSADGGLLYCTESDLGDDYKGLIAVRQGRTFEWLGQFPTYGLEPHDCHIVDGGSTMVISNGGSEPGKKLPPSVTYVDIKSEKLVERVEFDTPRINAGHLAVTSDGDLAVVSAPRKGMMFQRNVDDLGGVSLRKRGGKIKTMTEPADVIGKMLRESLSVAIHEPSATVGVTNPDGNIVTFWNLESGQFVKSLSIPSPRGIAMTLDGQEFLISYDGGTRLGRLPARSLEPLTNLGKGQPLLSGSHIVVHDFSV